MIKPDLYEPELNRLYAEVLKHYGVVADPACVRDPNRKGTVESAIQHTHNVNRRYSPSGQGLLELELTGGKNGKPRMDLRGHGPKVLPGVDPVEFAGLDH